MRKNPAAVARLVCLWSGPRNVSTALMYSFARRQDIEVVDEPLYGHYLRLSGAEHPGRDEVLAAMDCDGERVMRELLGRPQAVGKTTFAKQMAHHLLGLDTEFLGCVDNVLLIRDPAEMLPSLVKQLPHAQLQDTGLEQQCQLLEQLGSGSGVRAVLDSRELLLDPEGVLRQLCERLALPFDQNMLHWRASARPEDGVWAHHWYHAVHRSTGFSAYVPKGPLPDRLQPLYAACRPYYATLYAEALRARPALRGNAD